MIFWENALLRPGRESLTDNGVVVAADSINIINNVHPITQGFASGNRVVFTSAANMSVATGNAGPGTLTLARRAGSLDGAIVVAEAGATVADNYVTPARRVFMFFEDTSWQAATADAQTLLERAICWAMNTQSPGIAVQPQNVEACEGEPASFVVTANGSSPLSYQWRRNGSPIVGANARTLSIDEATHMNEGSYDCIVSNPCGQAISSAANLVITECCRADFDEDGSVAVPDIFAFLSAWFAQDAAADFDEDGSIAVPDIFAFLSEWFAGC
jgi:hypothetical protein